MFVLRISFILVNTLSTYFSLFYIFIIIPFEVGTTSVLYVIESKRFTFNVLGIYVIALIARSI